ncbi:hypothetical protein RUM43_012115 [Polyplax serrata]|uniref:DNA-binding protein RFX6 n=1 Tax=Polyplax serrata TaxID=468196 RepID=A0AAN8PK73_POLSC
MFQILPDNKNSVDYGAEENLTLFNCINNPREERFALGSVDETPKANELEPTSNCTKMQIVAREVKFQEGDRSVVQAEIKPHSTPATFLWLGKNYELAEGICIPRNTLYSHYVHFCQTNAMSPLNSASFGKIIRQAFPSLTTRRLGTRGQSQYHYCGIAIKDTSPYYEIAFSKMIFSW